MRTRLATAALILLATFLLPDRAGAFDMPDRTTHLGMRVLPAPGKMTIDGKAADWDLSGGIFACKGVSRYRKQYAGWFHMMYDADNIYLLVRWNDRTPMSNPLDTARDNGFDGDCLQVRFIMAPATPQERVSHITAWYGNKDNKHVVDVVHGRRFNEGRIPDAQTQGAGQAFLKHPGAKGYNQEISLPWKLLTKDGAPLKAGDKFVMTIQLNFSYGWRGRYRLFVTDVFRPEALVDRALIHEEFHCWGGAVLEPKGNVEPWPVRLFDGRMFAVGMKDRAPVADWKTEVIREKGATIVEPPRIQPVVRLAVESEPVAGVSITGDTPGNTNYTAVCEPDQTVVLVAPTHIMVAGKLYDFLRWRVDGDDFPDAVLKAEITMDMNRVATAVYEGQQHRLTVQSAPIMGVTITGDNRGVTDYSVLCESRQQITLTASDSADVDGKQYSFVRWIVNEEKRDAGLTRIQITMDSDYRATAMYEIETRPPDADPITSDASPAHGDTGGGRAAVMIGLGVLALLCAAITCLLWRRRRA